MTTTLDADVLLIQRDALRDALTKVLDTRAKEEISQTNLRKALQNYGPMGRVGVTRQHARVIDAVIAAEKEARVLLLTLKV